MRVEGFEWKISLKIQLDMAQKMMESHLECSSSDKNRKKKKSSEYAPWSDISDGNTQPKKSLDELYGLSIPHVLV